MSMITINFTAELKQAWMAGRASTLPKEYCEHLKIPRTFEEWIEQENKKPRIARG